MDKLSAKRLLELWKEAWEATDMSNQFTLSIEKKLAKHGISSYDIKVAIGKISKLKEPTQDEEDLVHFYGLTKHMREVTLVEKVGSATQGQIFLLKSQHGYKDQSVDLNVKQVETVVEYGTD